MANKDIGFWLFGNEEEGVQLEDQEQYEQDVEKDEADTSKDKTNSSKPVKQQAATTVKKNKVGRKAVEKGFTIQLGSGWTVDYAAMSVQIDNNLFTKTEVASNRIVTLEEIRVAYSQFSRSVEMSPTGTTWEMDETLKRLFPIVRGESKG